MCVLIFFSISGNSKPVQDRSEWQPAFNRHGFQRICKFPPAVKAHLICLALQREHSAEVSVVTPKQEIEDSEEDLPKTFLCELGRLLIARSLSKVEQTPFLSMNEFNEQIRLP